MSKEELQLQMTLQGRPLEQGLLGQLTRLEVRESDFDATVAAFRFNLAQSGTGELFPLDAEAFRPTAPLGLELTAPGGQPTCLFEGFITHVRPHFEDIESNCYVEVLAMDAALLLDAEERVATYPDMTDAEAAEEIFGRYHLPFKGDPTVARHQESHQLLVQRGTDWAFVRQLARRNGFCCYLEPDPLTGKVGACFKRRGVGDTPQPDLSILREKANLRWLDFQFVTTGPVRYVGAAIDPIAKRLVRTDGGPPGKPMGSLPLGAAIEEGLTSAGAQGVTALLRDVTPLDPALQAQGQGATEQASFAVQVHGELDASLYRGLLRARRPVLVKGVGRTYAGAYYVRTVRTTLAGGALTQTFVGQRNALGLSGEEPFGQSSEGGR